eukprot:UN22967
MSVLELYLCVLSPGSRLYSSNKIMTKNTNPFLLKETFITPCNCTTCKLLL